MGWSTSSQIGDGWMQGPAGSVATTWNPADKTAHLALSFGNRTALRDNTADTNEGIRSIYPSKLNQLIYVEHVIVQTVSFFKLGFALGTFNIGLGANLASGKNCGVAYNGNFYDQDSPDFGAALFASGFSAGDRIGIAFNTITQKFWARLNGGGWNPNLGGGDPAAGTGGVVATLSSMPCYVWVGVEILNSGDGFTTNFASTDWVNAAPAGYTQVGS